MSEPQPSRAPESPTTVRNHPAKAGFVLVETLPGDLPAGDRTPGSRYTVTRVLAQGGLGRVYVGEDHELHREVAIKEIRPDQAACPEARRRFITEAQVTGQLEHPNIVPVYEMLRRPGSEQPSYVMRMVRGHTLRDA